ncbi:hypothetical protein APSETT444_010478 [Aspergillus pseudonomiae]
MDSSETKLKHGWARNSGLWLDSDLLSGRRLYPDPGRASKRLSNSWRAVSLDERFGSQTAESSIGIDGALHLAEECQNATTAVPRALMSTLVIGFITSFAFMVTMLYCTSDLDAVVASSTGSAAVAYPSDFATRSPSAATVFVCLLVLAAIFALTGAQQTASRLTWSLARDRALIGSQWIGELHDSLEVPVWALVFNYAVMFLIGCIYLGSSSAFNAFIGTGLVLQHISYAFPAVMLLYRCRSAIWLPDVRPFRLPSPVGWAANLTTVCFAVLVLIFYDFPTVMPVTGSNMSEFDYYLFSCAR